MFLTLNGWMDKEKRSSEKCLQFNQPEVLNSHVIISTIPLKFFSFLFSSLLSSFLHSFLSTLPKMGNIDSSLKYQQTTMTKYAFEYQTQNKIRKILSESKSFGNHGSSSWAQENLIEALKAFKQNKSWVWFTVKVIMLSLYIFCSWFPGWWWWWSHRKNEMIVKI